MRFKILLFLTVPLFLFSCDPVNFGNNSFQGEGYVPVYSKDVSLLKQIKSEPARSTVNGGKIYTVGSLLFQVEKDSGIHIINYADPQNPQKLGFIKSFLCKEVAVKNGFVYTNNMADLVVIDISNPSNVQTVNRVEGVFPELSLAYPVKISQFETIYFECPDESKGTVIAWKKQTIKNPKCWR